MTRFLIPLLLMGCSSATDIGSATSDSVPTCLVPSSTYYLSFTETAGNCGAITGVTMLVDQNRSITPGSNSGLSCPIQQQNNCSPVSPDCIGGTDLTVSSFQLDLTDSGHAGNGTMQVTGINCSSSYHLELLLSE